MVVELIVRSAIVQEHECVGGIHEHIVVLSPLVGKHDRKHDFPKVTVKRHFSNTWENTPITYMLSLSKQKGSQAKSRKAVHISTYYSTTCEAIKS